MGFAGTAELGRELANKINAGALGTLLAGGTGGAAGGVADLGEWRSNSCSRAPRRWRAVLLARLSSALTLVYVKTNELDIQQVNRPKND